MKVSWWSAVKDAEYSEKPGSRMSSSDLSFLGYSRQIKRAAQVCCQTADWHPPATVALRKLLGSPDGPTRLSYFYSLCDSSARSSRCFLSISFLSLPSSPFHLSLSSHGTQCHCFLLLPPPPGQLLCIPYPLWQLAHHSWQRISLSTMMGGGVCDTDLGGWLGWCSVSGKLHHLQSLICVEFV